MPYSAQRDLRGKHPTNTYPYLISVDNTGSLFDGTGSQVTSINVTASFAVSASYEILYETSSSYAETSSVAISSSFTRTASFAISASYAPSPASSTTSSYFTGSQISASNIHYDGVLEHGDSKATGVRSVAFGSTTSASNNFTFAHGYNTHADGWGAHAEGNTTTAAAFWAHAEGSTTLATGDSAHSEGSFTQANAAVAHAEGLLCVADGAAAHAEGFYTSGSGWAAHAEGYQANAMATGSHSEGFATTASAEFAHSEGYQTDAAGTGSHSEGIGTVASGSYQHVQGQFNTHGNSTSLMVIGNGTDVSNRSDLALFNSQSIRFNQPLTSSKITGDTASMAAYTLTGSYTSTVTNHYTMSAGDNGKLLIINQTSSLLLGVPTTLPYGFSCTIYQSGSATASVHPLSTTIQNRQTHKSTAGQYAVTSLIRIQAGDFVFTGDTAA